MTLRQVKLSQGIALWPGVTVHELEVGKEYGRPLGIEKVKVTSLERLGEDLVVGESGDNWKINWAFVTAWR